MKGKVLEKIVKEGKKSSNQKKRETVVFMAYFKKLKKLRKIACGY